MYPNILHTGNIFAVKFIRCLTFDTHTQLSSQQTIHFVSSQWNKKFQFLISFQVHVVAVVFIWRRLFSWLYDIGIREWKVLEQHDYCVIRLTWGIIESFLITLDSSEFAKMVQEYVSPIRVHKYPFEMVMAVSTTTLISR